MVVVYEIEELLREEFQRTVWSGPAPEDVLVALQEPPTRAPEMIACAFLLLYAAYAIQRHHQMETGGYDLGIFEQIVRGYAAGQRPITELKAPGYDALGDHFHPILALLAPLYRAFPAAETLLVAQAALIAASIIPIGRSAVAVVGTTGGTVISVAYGLSWGLQEAVGFDFHEVCIGVPLVAMSLNRLLAGRWIAAAAWAVPLIAVKEDLPLTAAAIGVCLLIRGQRRLGAGLAAGGLLATAVIVLWVLPALQPDHLYVYADQIGRSTSGWGVAPKATTLALLLAPTVFSALRSPLLTVAVPTLAWRFLADNPLYWGTRFHYSAILMPIVFAAMIDAWRHRKPWPRPTVVVAGCLVVALAITPFRPLWSMAEPGFWRTSPTVGAMRDALRLIPDGVTVAATNTVAAQLTTRCRVRLLFLTPPERQDAQWIAARATEFAGDDDRSRWLERLASAGYEVVSETGALTILRRPPD